MNVEKIEVLTVNVKNLDEAIKKFSDILGTTFHNFGEPKMQKTTTPASNLALEQTKVKFAMDRRGFMELIESAPPVQEEGMRSIHYKVPNLEEAKEEMRLKGCRLIADIRSGNVKEAIFSPEDCCGVRLCFVEYDEPTLVDALLANPK
jgi:predicted enzyme related to lactoylglutathione lyase